MDEARKRAEARYQMAGESLVGNSSLRDALRDDQAEELLDWGLTQIRREATRTRNMPAEDAEPLLEKRVDAVRRVMIQANSLVEGLPDASKGRTRESIMQFVDALCEVDNRAVHVNDMLALERLASNREQLDSDGVFQRLMAIIRQNDEEE